MYNRHTSMYETMLDMARAFDSVKYSALIGISQTARLLLN